MKDHYIFIVQARYATYIVAKYLDTATVMTIAKSYKTIFPSGIIFTKSDSSNTDKQVEKLTREFNIHYRACIGLLIDFYLQEGV